MILWPPSGRHDHLPFVVLVRLVVVFILCCYADAEGLLVRLCRPEIGSVDVLVAVISHTFGFPVLLGLAAAENSRQKLAPCRLHVPLPNRQIVIVGPLDKKDVGDENKADAVPPCLVVQVGVLLDVILFINPIKAKFCKQHIHNSGDKVARCSQNSNYGPTHG